MCFPPDIRGALGHNAGVDAHAGAVIEWFPVVPLRWMALEIRRTHESRCLFTSRSQTRTTTQLARRSEAEEDDPARSWRSSTFCVTIRTS